MTFRRFLHIVAHPYMTYEEHRVKEINLFKRRKVKDTYYIIRCDLPKCGLFAIFMYVLDHIAYATDKGYIPILESRNYSCLYKEKKAVLGTRDPWKYYFEPISDVKPMMCWKYGNVLLGAVKFPRYKAIYYYNDKEKNYLPSQQRIDELFVLVNKYIRFRPDLQRNLEERTTILNKFSRVLGVHIRGTDMYTAGKQHPVPSGKSKDFSIIDDIIARHQITGIFLCSDTESTIKLFRDYYSDMVITTDALRQINDGCCGIHQDKTLDKQRKNHKYLLGEEVITDMYLLSKCDVLVCGPSNVAFAAIIYNHNQYDEIYYFT